MEDKELVIALREALSDIRNKRDTVIWYTREKDNSGALVAVTKGESGYNSLGGELIADMRPRQDETRDELVERVYMINRVLLDKTAEEVHSIVASSFNTQILQYGWPDLEVEEK